MTKQFIFTILSSLLLVTACSEQSESAVSQGQAAPKAQSVSVITIEKQNVVMDTTLPGRVSAFRQSLVRPQVNGVITERLFEQGALVEKGQQLYQIDDAQYRAELQSAQADVLSAQANVSTLAAKEKRYQNLVKTNALSQQDFDDVKAQLAQAKAAVNVAKAAVDLAKVNVEYTKVRAPIDGRISRSFVTEGSLVTSNQTDTLASITQLDPVYVDMQLSGTQALKLQKQFSFNRALPVTLILDELTGDTYAEQGKLEFAEVTIDESTGSLALRAIFPNPDHVLLPGLFVRTRITFSQTDEIVVPQRATMRQPDGTLVVYVVDQQQTIQARPITATSAYQDKWVVSSGLNVGDTVVVAGYHKVRPGAKVSPQPWKDTSSSQAQ